MVRGQTCMMTQSASLACFSRCSQFNGQNLLLNKTLSSLQKRENSVIAAEVKDMFPCDETKVMIATKNHCAAFYRGKSVVEWSIVLPKWRVLKPLTGSFRFHCCSLSQGFRFSEFQVKKSEAQGKGILKNKMAACRNWLSFFLYRCCGMLLSKLLSHKSLRRVISEGRTCLISFVSAL